MTKPSLNELLRSGEWNGAEFKAAKRALPKSVFETISTFANTRGGWIVLGVTQDGEHFEVTGVDEPDKLQNDFLSVLHAGQKVSHDVDVSEHRYEHDGKVVLAFQVAENLRTRKLVYIDGDIRRTFLRKGGGDYRAQHHEIERMLRDASEDRWDSQPFTRVDIDEGVFHSASLKWYRDRFHATNPGVDIEQPHHEFLYEWGYLVKESGKLLPTRGAVALFGSLRGVRNLIPKPVLDVRFLGYASTEDFDETRWIDRFVSEVNIIETWQQLLAKIPLLHAQDVPRHRPGHARTARRAGGLPRLPRGRHEPADPPGLRRPLAQGRHPVLHRRHPVLESRRQLRRREAPARPRREGRPQPRHRDGHPPSACASRRAPAFG